MIGAIRKREILAHPIVTVRCFGLPVFVRAMLAGRQETFLSLLAGMGAFEPRLVDVPELLTRCMRLEERAQRIYAELASCFVHTPPIASLFQTLSCQEGHHAELLRLCGRLATAIGPEGWRADPGEASERVVDRAEQELAREEAAVAKIVTVPDALRAAIRIETSEINRAFAAAVDATQSPFVRSLDTFHSAEDRHRKYLHDQIVTLAPSLAGEARALLDQGSFPPS